MPKNTLYQFAGMRSNLPNGITTENYIKALTMYNEGHSHKEVLKATGWFRGVDGAMRYEIPDNESSLDMDYLNRLKDGDFELLTLAAVLKHDKLYAAYPSLKHIRFKLSDFGGDTNTQGSWNQRNNCITMSNQLLAEPETLLDVLLHEIQHSIQSIEGYNMGGNTNDSFAASVEPSIQQNVKLAEQQLGEWMSNNSEAFRKAKEATEKARYARLFTSFRKLQKYSVSQSPSRVKRHIENEGRWLYSDLLKKEGTNQTLEEAAKIELDWYNMPTKNNQNQKSAFLQKWAANCADVYLSQIPEKWKEEFLWAEGDFQKHANRYQAIADSLNKDIIDLKGVEDDLNAAKSSLRNYQEQLHTAETDKRKFLAPSASDLVYRHSAGEIEANNTMNRRQMTDEERLNKPFDMTHDIPTHKQIVYFRGSSYTSSQLSREVAQIKPKGSVTFEGKRFAEIILNKEADFSTIVHEGAHIYLEALTELAQHPTATQEIKQELNDILEWLEVDPKEWGEMDIHQRRDMHEVFAEGFESFVAKGGEDGLLTKIFDGFKKWISDIYQCLSNIPETKPLTASVNEVFAKATREVSPRSDFAIKLSKSIEQHSNMDEASALASSQIIDSSFNHLAGVAGLDREEFNKIFSINVVGVEPKAIHSKKMTL